MTELSRRRFAVLTDSSGEELGNAGPVSRRRRELPPYGRNVLGAAFGFIAPQRERDTSGAIRPQPFEVTEAKREERRKRAKAARKPPPRFPKRTRQPQGVGR